MALTLKLPRTDDSALIHMARDNPGYQFERRQDGTLIVTPTGSKSGYRSANIVYQLTAWSHAQDAGPVFDSSAGFRLPDGSVLSPDASWVHRERWMALTRDDQEAFAPLCPNVVAEIRSRTDSIAELRTKMQSYRDNGAQVGILIDPYGRFLEVWRQDGVEHFIGNQLTIILDERFAAIALNLNKIYE